MTGAAQLIEGLVKPQPAALMRAHPRNRLESAADPTYEPDHRTDVKGFHHAGGHICARRDDPPAAISGLHRGPLGARVAVGGDASVAAPATMPAPPASDAADAATTTWRRVACGPVRGAGVSWPPGIRAASRRWRSVRKCSPAHRLPSARHAIGCGAYLRRFE